MYMYMYMYIHIYIERDIGMYIHTHIADRRPTEKPADSAVPILSRMVPRQTPVSRRRESSSS